MARKRMIDPHIWEDPSFNALTAEARLLFIGMISHSDDEGYIRGDAGSLKRLIFGFDEKTKEDVEKMVKQLGAIKSLHFFTKNNETFAHFLKWSDYQKQRDDRIVPSVYPMCDKCQTSDGHLPAEVKLSKEKLREDNVRKGSAEGKPINPQPAVSDSLIESKTSLAQIAKAREKLKGKLILNGFALLIFLFAHATGSYAATVTVRTTVSARDVKKSAVNLLGQKAKRVPSTQDKIAGKEATLRREWSDIEIARYIKSKSWPYETAIKLAKSENYWNKTKSFNCSRIGGPNKDGSYDTGIFQINSIHAPRLAKLGMTLEDMKDCKKNIDYAHDWLYKFQGFAPWSAYKNGSYLSHVPIDL